MSTKYGALDINCKPIENDQGSVEAVDLSDPCRRRWRWRISQKYLYGLGHVYNDLCAAMWFSYMMLFFQTVLQMRTILAGTMLLLGQVLDALATPIVGILADKYRTKKFWHLLGSILVLCTFPLLFVRCWGCTPDVDSDYISWWMPLYYAILISLFQVGWAIVQIAHLSMIPIISEQLEVRSELTSIRYMASVVSNLLVYLITWIVLRATTYSTIIGPSDDYKFRDVSLIISAIGVTTFSLFHILFKLKSKPLLKSNGQIPANGTTPLIEDAETSNLGRSKIIHFLRKPLLYQSSLLCVCSRLCWALTLVYVPLFVEERLSVNQTEGSELVASVPLVLYISSFFLSLILKSKISSCGNKTAYFIGSCLSVISSVWIALTIDPEASIVQIYMVAALMGAGSSITLVSSLCITADLIGSHSHQGAAIYSIVTFADKLITGIAVISIQNYKCDDAVDCPQYYRGVLTYVCGGCALLGLISLSFTKINIGTKSQIT